MEHARALALEPGLPEAQIALGRALYRNDRKADGESALKKLLQRDDGHAEAHYRLGVIYRWTTRPQQASLSFRNAINARPGFWRYYSSLGAFYLRSATQSAADFSESRSLLLKAQRLAPRGVYRPSVQLTTFEIRQGRFDEAEQDILSIPTYARSISAINNIATVLFYQGRFEESERYYRIAVDQEPKDPSHRASVGDTLAARGRTEAAREEFETALALIDDKIESRSPTLKDTIWKSTYLAKLDRCREALALVSPHESNASMTDDLTHTLAKTFALCGEFEKARGLLSRVIEAGYSPALIRRQVEFRDLLQGAEDPLLSI